MFFHRWTSASAEYTTLSTTDDDIVSVLIDSPRYSDILTDFFVRMRLGYSDKSEIYGKLSCVPLAATPAPKEALAQRKSWSCPNSPKRQIRTTPPTPLSFCPFCLQVRFLDETFRVRVSPHRPLERHPGVRHCLALQPAGRKRVRCCSGQLNRRGKQRCHTTFVAFVVC